MVRWLLYTARYYPHVRGDGPRAASIPKARLQFSPREWGSSGGKSVKQFFTQCLVDHQAIVRARLRHHGDWHQRIWETFNPVDGDGASRGFLYSVEETANGCRALILSDSVPTRPDWCPMVQWTTKPVPDGFLTHQKYVFSLTANATRVRDGKRISLAKRAGVDDDPEVRLLDWLERQAIKGGFRFERDAVSVLPLPVERFPYDGREVTFQYTRFQGVLEVTDQALFQITFNSGIGRAKGFGAGLLLLKPIK
jgi:CRISPR system Cascade subunit CasE